jgi:hypothetical protein
MNDFAWPCADDALLALHGDFPQADRATFSPAI